MKRSICQTGRRGMAGTLFCRRIAAVAVLVMLGSRSVHAAPEPQNPPETRPDAAPETTAPETAALLGPRLTLRDPADTPPAKPPVIIVAKRSGRLHLWLYGLGAALLLVALVLAVRARAGQGHTPKEEP